MRHLRVAWAIVLFVAATVAGSPAAGQTPAAALERLKAGNARFVRDASGDLPVDAERRQAQLKGQAPYAIVLSCADSRVPPEVIFNAGLGELFVIRTAGEVTDKAVLASIEYAAEHLKAPLLVVMGHEMCGAVTAAIETRPGSPSQGPNLDALVGAIRPAFEHMHVPADRQHMTEAVLANTEQVIEDVLEHSAIVEHLAGQGRLQLVGAFYELGTGRVRFNEPVKVAGEHAPQGVTPHR